MADNTVTLVGNLVREVSLRHLQSGSAVANTGIAVNRRYQRNGEWEEETSFFDVTLFGDLASNLATSLDKGARVIAQGRLEQQRWEDKEGNNRSKVVLIADAIGPELRWATASVERIQGNGGGNRSRRDEPFPDDEDEDEF